MKKCSFNRLFNCIDFIREKQGLTVDQFCQQINVTPRTYKRWLSGNTRTFTVKHVRDIVEVLQIPKTDKWLRIFAPDLEDVQPDEESETA